MIDSPSAAATTDASSRGGAAAAGSASTAASATKGSAAPKQPLTTTEVARAVSRGDGGLLTGISHTTELTNERYAKPLHRAFHYRGAFSDEFVRPEELDEAAFIHETESALHSITMLRTRHDSFQPLTATQQARNSLFGAGADEPNEAECNMSSSVRQKVSAENKQDTFLERLEAFKYVRKIEPELPPLVRYPLEPREVDRRFIKYNASGEALERFVPEIRKELFSCSIRDHESHFQEVCITRCRRKEESLARRREEAWARAFKPPIYVQQNTGHIMRELVAVIIGVNFCSRLRLELDSARRTPPSAGGGGAGLNDGSTPSEGGALGEGGQEARRALAERDNRGSDGSARAIPAPSSGGGGEREKGASGGGDGRKKREAIGELKKDAEGVVRAPIAGEAEEDASKQCITPGAQGRCAQPSKGGAGQKPRVASSEMDCTAVPVNEEDLKSFRACGEGMPGSLGPPGLTDVLAVS